LLFQGSFFSVVAQQKSNESVIRVNTLHDTTGKFQNTIYKYKDFQNGKIIFSDGVAVDTRLNFQRVLQQLQFINPKGDTLAVAHPETYSCFVINTDTLYYSEKGFLFSIYQQGQTRLVKKEVLKFIGKEKKGAYGSYSEVSSANSNSTYSNDDQFTTYIGIDENSIYKMQYEYFLIDKYHTLFPANKKSFYNLYSSKQKQLRDYMEANNVNFKREKDLVTLVTYMQEL
jgi:hypothetical protein